MPSMTLEDGHSIKLHAQLIGEVRGENQLGFGPLNEIFADAAVDGVIPSKMLPKPETLFARSLAALKEWRDRVNEGRLFNVNRKELVFPLHPEIVEQLGRRIGDFSLLLARPMKPGSCFSTATIPLHTTDARTSSGFSGSFGMSWAISYPPAELRRFAGGSQQS